MKKMRKKIWASFMTLAMTVTMLSGLSMTARADDAYDIQAQSAVQLNEEKSTLTAADFNFSVPSFADLIYDGTAKTVNIVKKGNPECGTITVHYYDDKGNIVAPAPVEVGKYTVRIDVAENDTYNAANNLTDASWEFEIDYGYAMAGSMYGILGMNAEGWSKDKVTISADYRYQIAKDISGPFASFIQYDDETNNGNVIFYIKASSTGKIYKGSAFYRIDRTDPVITGIENGKAYCESTSFTVTDVALKSVTDGENQITAQADGNYVLSGLGDHVITATDYAGNSTTVTVTVKEHNFSGEMQSDESGHWKACQNEGCHQIDKKPHTPNIAAATETEDKVCTECNFVIEPKLGHLHKLHLESVKAKAATCTEDGNKAYYRCTEDQQCFLDENAENPVELSDLIIPSKGGHNFSGEMQSDESGHWKACQNEGCHQIDKKPHTPNIAAATETEDKVCTECNFVIEPKSGHLHKLHLESVKAKAATCTEDGNKAYYRCAEDQQCFLDENAENPVELSDLIIPAAGHQTSDWIVDKEATITAEGSRHKECTVCSTVLETAVIEKLPMVSYDITEGADGTYTLNSDESYTICSNGEVAKFVNVEVDGKIVDAQYYTVKSDSMIVTFTKTYMDSLSVGEHVVKMNFIDGAAETTFVIAKKDSVKEPAKNLQKEPQKTPEKDTKANTNVTKSPQTGDSSHVTLWLAILVISGSIAIGSATMLRRKKKYTA